MKAAFLTKYGGPEVIEIREIPIPKPGEDEVLVKVEAASINSWDLDIMTGRPFIYRLMFGLLKPKIKTTGADIAGRIEKCGGKVTQFKPGDEVFGDICETWGGFAEYVCVKEKSLYHKPAKMSFNDAASLPQAGLLALQSLLQKEKVQPGEKVLINGAGGGVGTFAVQIAKHFGAKVTAVDSASKLDLLNALGAIATIDYQKEDFSKNHQQYDRIIEVVGNRNLFQYLTCLRPGGRLVLVGGKVGVILQVAIFGGLASLKGNKKAGLLIHKPNLHLNLLTELFESGVVKPIIDSTYSLENLPIAMQRLSEGKAIGKLIITMERE